MSETPEMFNTRTFIISDLRVADLDRQPAIKGDINSEPFNDMQLRIFRRHPDRPRDRRVVTRSRFRSTGKFPSWKMQRMIQWESSHELNAFRLLEADPRVTRFYEQPFTIEYLSGNQVKKHIPDILVEIDGTKEIWEIKTSGDAINPDIAFRTSLLEKELPDAGYKYRTVLAEHLEEEPRLNNVIKLLRFGYITINELEREAIRLAIKRDGFLTWSDACSGRLGKRGQAILCRSVLNGSLLIDISTPLLGSTRFIEGGGF